MNCRFYGKDGMHGRLIDSNGNQCALVGHAFAPCAMERDGLDVDERCCQRYKEGLRVAILFALPIAAARPAAPSLEGMTAARLKEMAIAISDNGYHVTHGKTLYAWAEQLAKDEVTR